MNFKKFVDFIIEKTKPDPGAIEDAVADKPVTAPETECPKCGSIGKICKCYTEDYYNAKTPQYAPKGKIRKNNEKTK